MNTRVLLLILALVYAQQLYGADNVPPDLKALRNKLTLAINDGRTTDSLYNVLNRIPQKTPITIAYLGVLDALKAKHSWNPYSKIRYLDASESAMQQALNQDPHNIEILFIRFSIQYNVPGFLGYGKNLIADREDLITQLRHKNYGTADKELTMGIIKFLIDCKRCTPAENALLYKQLSAL